MRQLSMVKDEGYKAILSALYPMYELPSGNFLTKTNGEKYFEAKMMQALQETKSTALTIDFKTSSGTYAYICAPKFALVMGK